MMNHRFKWQIMLTAVLIVAAAAFSGCSTVGVERENGRGDEARSITVLGHGEATGIPDVALIQLGVNLFESDLSQAVSEANETVQRVHDALLEFGIEQADIQTTNYNVWPEDQHDPETGMYTGERMFRVEVTMQVVVRDAERMSEVLDAGLEAGANNVYGISFRIDDTKPIAREARSNAIADATSRAEQLTIGMGLELGPVVSISEGVGQSQFVPPEYYGIGGGGGSISPGQSTVMVEVQVTYQVLQP